MIHSLIKMLFPNRCVACGEIIDEGNFLCEYCLEFLERCQKDRLCLKCGCNKKECQCKYRVYSFDGITAPFYYEGIAKIAMFHFKFRKKPHYGRFFAENMALAYKQSFNDIKFDYIVYVPMYPLRQSKRGYNQSKILARELGEILHIPVLDNVLFCRRKNKRQHLTALKERFDNVRGIYYTDLKLNGETFLLIDDIKTTGATLGECSKTLMKAGAGRVYCLVGLTTNKRKKGKKNGN